MRLLAVDDDPAILDLLPIIFRQARLPQITVAGSGPAALSILAERDTLFDALLLDIEMPGMTGIELCQRVRQTPEYRTTPVLMLTAATDDTRIEHAFAAGADDYITKPFEVKDIVTRVRVAERFADRAQHIPLLDPDCRAPEAEEGLHGFKVGAPVRLGRAPQVISPNALGNYLSQLARHRLDSCTIFAAQIDGIDSHYSLSRPHEFTRLLHSVAGAIRWAVGCPHVLMSYEGDGTFLCIMQGAQPPAWPALESRIEDAVAAAPSPFDADRARDVPITVGNPIMPNASRTQRVKKTFDRARDRLAQRLRTKQGRPAARHSAKRNLS